MTTSRPTTSFKFRGGSFHALVVKPETPINAWLADVDALLSRSPGFFAGKSVVIDVSDLSLTKQDFLGLLDELRVNVKSAFSVSKEQIHPVLMGVFRSWREAKPTSLRRPRRRRFHRPHQRRLAPCLSMLQYARAN